MYFSEEEWRLLDETQKQVYREIMLDNYENVRSLGEKWLDLGEGLGLTGAWG